LQPIAGASSKKPKNCSRIASIANARREWHCSCKTVVVPATVWKGYITFGLVSFPIRLYVAARPETVHFHLLHKKDESRIKEVWFCAEENKPVDRKEMAKGYEYRKGQYVVVEDTELKKIAPPTATAMEILQFVAAEEVDPVWLEKSYYVAAEEAGTRPYALLHKAMAETKRHAVAKMTMHGREHIVMIRPDDKGLILHTLYYSNELHRANQRGKSAEGKFSSKEMDLAKRLIDTLESAFRPERYEDEYRKNVERLIAQKRKGKKVTAIAQPKVAPVVDIMDALRRSLAQKPVAKARKAAGMHGKAVGKRTRAAA
jgi:DNA end-binding protein Ku